MPAGGELKALVESGVGIGCVGTAELIGTYAGGAGVKPGGGVANAGEGVDVREIGGTGATAARWPGTEGAKCMPGTAVAAVGDTGVWPLTRALAEAASSAGDDGVDDGVDKVVDDAA